MTENKSALRKTLIARRLQLSPQDMHAVAAHVAHHLLRDPIIQEERIIAGYLPVRGEVDILPLLAALHERGKKLCLPVPDNTTKLLSFRSWKPGDDLVKGLYDIDIPAPDAPEVMPDALLVPLVGYDTTGHRLGYGGGYYDRTLPRLRSAQKITAIGIAYAMQKVDGSLHEDHDAPLDAVATEHGLEWFEA